MSSCIHTLRVSIIVTLLNIVGRRTTGACPSQGTREQSHAGAYRCAAATIERGAGSSAHYRPDYGTLHAAVGGSV